MPRRAVRNRPWRLAKLLLRPIQTTSSWEPILTLLGLLGVVAFSFSDWVEQILGKDPPASLRTQAA